MTKEVAEKIVSGITDKIECNTADIDDWAEFWGFTREEYEEFLNMAIKALEQTEPEKCGDCISRERLYNECLKIQCNKKERYFDIDDVRKLIVKAPSVEPERKTGKWIDGKCNRCGTHAPFWAMSTAYYCSDFCPNCGADMRGEEHGL